MFLSHQLASELAVEVFGNLDLIPHGWKRGLTMSVLYDAAPVALGCTKYPNEPEGEKGPGLLPLFAWIERGVAAHVEKTFLFVLLSIFFDTKKSNQVEITCVNHLLISDLGSSKSSLPAEVTFGLDRRYFACR